MALPLDEFAKTLTCSLCNELFKSPYTFSTCGHTFCYECVISRIEGPGINTSQCPTCKQPGWKNDLKPNHQFNNAVEHVKSLLQFIQTTGNAEPSALPSGRAAAENAIAPAPAAAEEEALPSPAQGLDDQERDLEAEHHPDIDFGAADFGRAWQQAQLSAGPPTSRQGLAALKEEIALLESALQLCDIIVCVENAAAEALPLEEGDLEAQQPQQQHREAADDDRVVRASQHTGSKKPSQRLSQIASQPDREHLAVVAESEKENDVVEQQQQQQNSQQPCSINLPAKAKTSSSLGKRHSEPLEAVGAEELPEAAEMDVELPQEQQKTPDDAQNPAPPAVPAGTKTIKRRNVERQLAAAEALAQHALHMRGARVAPLEPSAIPQRLRIPKEAPHIGMKVRVLWTDGVFLGQVKAYNAKTGEHQIHYEDGEIQWQNLDEEEWWPYNEEEAEEQPAAAMEVEDGEGPSSKVPRAAPALPVGLGIIPDSQAVDGSAEERLVLSGRGSGASAAAPAAPAAPTMMPHSIIGTQGAASVLQLLGEDSHGFVKASQLPRVPEEDAEEQEPPEVPAAPESTQLFGLSFPAPAPLASPAVAPTSKGSITAVSRPVGNLQHSRGGASSKRTGGNNTSNKPDIRSLLLSQSQKAASAAGAAKRPLSICIASNVKGLGGFVASLRQYVPDLVCKAAVTEGTTHVIVDCDDSMVSPTRSRAYLEGLASGCWIVCRNWLEASVNAKGPVPEAIYEVQGCNPAKSKYISSDVQAQFYGGPERCRMLVQTGRPKLFAGKTVRLQKFDEGDEEKTRMSKRIRDVVKGVLKFGGATVLEAGPMAKDMLVITNDDVLKEGLRQRGFKKVVAPQWVIDSVSSGKLLPLDKYRH